MTVVSEGPLCLKIHLNKAELKKYFVSYSKIHFRDPNIKKTISLLFDAAVTSSEFETNGKRVIEVFPTPSGGCILKFTSEPLPPIQSDLATNTNLRLRSKNGKNNPYIFAFYDFENLLKVVERLSIKDKNKKYISSLYSCNNRYFLKINIPIFDIRTALFINEFSVFSAKGISNEGFLNEYTKCLIKNNAIDVLYSAFIK